MRTQDYSRDPWFLVQREISEENFYQIQRGSILAFEIDIINAVLVTAAHTTAFNNQSATVSAWLSNVPAGMSLENKRINLTQAGYSWLIYTDTTTNMLSTQAASKIFVNNNKYFMCFQNLENKTNHFYFSYKVL